MLDVDGEKITIDSDSDEVNDNNIHGSDSGKEGERVHHDNVGVSHIEQIPPKSVEEEFSKLESMISLLEKDLEQFNQTRQKRLKEQISEEQLVEKLKHLQTALNAIQGKEDRGQSINTEINQLE